MTPQEYISSGILETYALGSATPAEMQEVEMMVSKYPEVKKALDEICDGLENYATLHAVEPDEKLRENILAEISSGKTENEKSGNNISEKGKVLALQPEKSSRFKTLAIAASVLLVLSVGVNFYLWMQTGSANEKVASLQNSLVSNDTASINMMLRNAQIRSEKDSLLNVLGFLRNPMTQSVALNSAVDGHPMKAVVHWNMKSMQVAVDPMTLPTTSPDQKYVLWAIVKGKPVNEGSFSKGDSTGIQMMNTVQQADSFAISLEKTAAVDAPAGPIYVMGKPLTSQP